jgi:hypothetical protein
MRKLMLFLSGVGVVLLQMQLGPLFAQGNSNKEELPVAGIHWARGEKPNDAGKPGGGASTSPNLTWHGGPIMPAAEVTPIFWGPSWGSKAFDGDKISGLETFYIDIKGSNYASTTSEFTSGTPTPINYHGYKIDLSQAPGNGNRTSPILAEVCRQITAVPNGYYPVYVDTPRGHAGFCAWHSAGSCGSVPVQFAFFFNLDGDLGCDPQDTSTGHSQGLSALANVSGHELSEAVTDPRLNAWYDSSGSENADKCAWSFSQSPLTFHNGSQWKIQGNWSNNAYSSATGYPNTSGQKGCIDGN